MKKIKLITSLSTLGVLAATVPVVATSCTNEGDIILQEKDNCKYENNTLSIFDCNQPAAATLLLKNNDEGKFTVDETSKQAGIIVEEKTLFIPALTKNLKNITVSCEGMKDLNINLDIPELRTINVNETTNCKYNDETLTIADRNKTAIVKLSLSSGNESLTLDGTSSAYGITLGADLKTLTIPPTALNNNTTPLDKIVLSCNNTKSLDIKLILPDMENIEVATDFSPESQIESNCKWETSTKATGTLTVTDRVNTAYAKLSVTNWSKETSPSFTLDEDATTAGVKINYNDSEKALVLSITTAAMNKLEELKGENQPEITIYCANCNALTILLAVAPWQTLTVEANENSDWQIKAESLGTMTVKDRGKASSLTIKKSFEDELKLDEVSSETYGVSINGETLTIPASAYESKDNPITSITITSKNLRYFINVKTFDWGVINVDDTKVENCSYKNNKLTIVDLDKDATIGLYTDAEGTLKVDDVAKSKNVTVYKKDNNHTLYIPKSAFDTNLLKLQFLAKMHRI